MPFHQKAIALFNPSVLTVTNLSIYLSVPSIQLRLSYCPNQIWVNWKTWVNCDTAKRSVGRCAIARQQQTPWFILIFA